MLLKHVNFFVEISEVEMNFACILSTVTYLKTKVVPQRTLRSPSSLKACMPKFYFFCLGNRELLRIKTLDNYIHSCHSNNNINDHEQLRTVKNLVTARLQGNLRADLCLLVKGH